MCIVTDGVMFLPVYSQLFTAIGTLSSIFSPGVVKYYATTVCWRYFHTITDLIHFDLVEFLVIYIIFEITMKMLFFLYFSNVAKIQ